MTRTQAETGAGVSCKGYGQLMKENDRLRVKVDTLRFLLNQRDAEIERLRGLLRETERLLESCTAAEYAWAHKRAVHDALAGRKP